MSKTRFPTDAALLEAAARLANLPLPAKRPAELVPAMDVSFNCSTR